MQDFTEGYRLHLIRMNGEAQHNKYVAAMRLLQPDSRIEPAVTRCWENLDALRMHLGWIPNLIASLQRLGRRATRAHAVLKRQELREFQARTLAVSMLESSLAKAAASPRSARVTARSKAQSNGWNLISANRED